MSISRRVVQVGMVLFLAAVLLHLDSRPAYAQELIEPLNNTLDFLVRVAQGPAAISLGILILLGSVVAFAVGRLPPSQLLQVVMVLALYFGAPRIVQIFKDVASR